MNFQRFLTASKGKPFKLESDRGAIFYNSFFQNFLKSKNIQQYSRFTDRRPSIAERVFKTIRYLLKKPVFEDGKANWISELSFVIKKYNNTFYHSTKMTPIQASKKLNEKLVYSNLQDKRNIFNPKCKIGQLVRTADIKRVFKKGDSTNYSYILYTITEVMILFLHIDLTIYPRDIMKNYYFLRNYLLNKTNK